MKRQGGVKRAAEKQLEALLARILRTKFKEHLWGMAQQILNSW